MDNTRIIINNKCELMISPIESLYEEGYTYLEFLDGDDVDLMSTLIISQDPELFKYYLSSDGLYMYYRWKIATTDLLEDTDKKDRLYFDNNSEKLMIGDKELEEEDLRHIINDDAPDLELGIIETFEKPIFSICKISLCLENLQRKYIFEQNPLYTGSKCGNDSDKSIRDFLFSSIFLLRILIKQQRYEEALKILNILDNCELCNSTYKYKNKNLCGCN